MDIKDVVHKVQSAQNIVVIGDPAYQLIVGNAVDNLNQGTTVHRWDSNHHRHSEITDMAKGGNTLVICSSTTRQLDFIAEKTKVDVIHASDSGPTTPTESNGKILVRLENIICALNAAAPGEALVRADAAALSRVLESSSEPVRVAGEGERPPDFPKAALRHIAERTGDPGKPSGSSGGSDDGSRSKSRGRTSSCFGLSGGFPGSRRRSAPHGVRSRQRRIRNR